MRREGDVWALDGSSGAQFRVKHSKGLGVLIERRAWERSAWAKLQDTVGLDREHIVALSLDVMPGPDLDTSNDWATLGELNHWMPLEAIDLRKLQPGQWTRVKLEIKEEHLKAMKALFKVVSVVSSGGSVSGALYLDNLAFTVKARKS
jgi:hypothetical protein